MSEEKGRHLKQTEDRGRAATASLHATRLKMLNIRRQEREVIHAGLTLLQVAAQQATGGVFCDWW